MIGVMHRAGLRATPPQRHLERPNHELPIVDRGERPPDDETRVQVDDGRQEDAAGLADPQLGGVADPASIGTLGLETARQKVGRNWLAVVSHRRALVPSAHAGHEALLLHQPNHPLAADVLLVGLEVLEDPRATVRGTPGRGDSLRACSKLSSPKRCLVLYTVEVPTPMLMAIAWSGDLASAASKIWARLILRIAPLPPLTRF